MNSHRIATNRNLVKCQTENPIVICLYALVEKVLESGDCRKIYYYACSVAMHRHFFFFPD